MSLNAKEVIDELRATIETISDLEHPKNFFFACKHVHFEQKGQHKVKYYHIYLYAFGGMVCKLSCQDDLCTHLNFSNVKSYVKYNPELTDLPLSKWAQDIKAGLDYFKKNVDKIATAYKNRAEGTAPSSRNKKIYLERTQETRIAAMNNKLSVDSDLAVIEIERNMQNPEKDLNDSTTNCAATKADLVFARWDGEYLTFYFTEYKCTVDALVSENDTLEAHYDKMSVALQDVHKDLYDALCIMLDIGLIDVCESDDTPASDILAAIKQLPAEKIRQKMLFLFSDMKTLRDSECGKKALESAYKYIQGKDSGRKDALFYVIPPADPTDECPLDTYEPYKNFNLYSRSIESFVPLFKSEHAFCINKYWMSVSFTEYVDEESVLFYVHVCSSHDEDADLEEMRFHVGPRRYLYLSGSVFPDSCELVLFKNRTLLRWKPCIKKKNGSYIVEVKEELKKHDIPYRDCPEEDRNPSRSRIGTHGICLSKSIWLDDVSSVDSLTILYTQGSHMFCGVEVYGMKIYRERPFLGDWTAAYKSLGECNFDETETTEFLNRLTFNGQELKACSAWFDSYIQGKNWRIQHFGHLKDFPDGVLSLKRRGKEAHYFTPPEGNGDNAEWIVSAVIECLKILRDESNEVGEGNISQGSE